MELSYAAYNPIADNEAVEGLPGNFREPPFDNDEWTAEADLESKGFEATAYNYPDEDASHYAAHTIGHRTITDYTTEVTNNELLDNNSVVNNADMDLDTGNTGTDSGILVTNSAEIESNGIERQLVVVSVRGSVTLLDWVMNFCTQFHNKAFEFEDGCEEVLKSLYGYNGCTECDGNDKTCPCKGYLINHNITNPIILVTGHSLGAAIANLVAAELNIRMPHADVYAYTFATPTVTSLPTIPYPNIFNILNTNDVVTYVPNSWFIPNINLWSRHGIDIPLDIPYSDTKPDNWLGMVSHSMEVYMRWMKNNVGMSYSEILAESAESRTRGLLPWIVKIKCPVGVTVKDSEGNIIAYESQQEGITYPEITDTGIVSWIDDDGAKVFFMPHYSDASKIEIDAYDYGTMTMTMGLLGVDETDETEAPNNSITYNNVNLFPGRAFEVDLTEITEEVNMDDISLMEVEVNENGEREEIGEITDLNPYLISASVDVDEVVHGQPCTMTFVTHKDAVKTQIQYNGTVATVTFSRDHPWIVSLVEDGDTLIWTIQPVLNRIGEHVFDVNVKMGSTWYSTEKVFALKIT